MHEEIRMLAVEFRQIFMFSNQVRFSRAVFTLDATRSFVIVLNLE